MKVARGIGVQAPAMPATRERYGAAIYGNYLLAGSCSHNRTHNALSRLLPFFLMLVGCIHFAVHYVWNGGMFLGLSQYADEVVSMPYQSRILIAWLLRGTIRRPIVYRTLFAYTTHLPIQLRDPYKVGLIAIVFVFALIACLGCRATIKHLSGDSRFADWMCLLTLAMISYFSFVAINYGYLVLPYDIPSVAFFSLGVWAVLRRKYALLTGIFALGALNRETYIFITLFAVLYAGFSTKEKLAGFWAGARPVLPFALVQLTFWLATRVWFMHCFASNYFGNDPRFGLFAVQVVQNIHYVFNPFQWPLLLEVAAVLTLPLILGGPWIADRALVQATTVVLSLWILGMFLVGIIIEVRVFDELTAFLVPCVASAVWGIVKNYPRPESPKVGTRFS